MFDNTRQPRIIRNLDDKIKEALRAEGNRYIKDLTKDAHTSADRDRLVAQHRVNVNYILGIV